VRPPLVSRDLFAGLVFYGSVAMWIASELRIRAAHPGGTGVEQDRGSRLRLLVLIFAAISVALSVVSVPHTRLDGWWPVGVGAGLVLAGVALRQWSVATLGRFFTTTVEIQPGHQVIQTGPYAIVRHPSYLGGLLSLTGFGVGLGDWASILACASFGTAAFVQRIAVEEQALRSLGDTYRQYAARHARLIPGLW
jgi:protein-S-isoprenylcysteine O-methyltransferase Ste14